MSNASTWASRASALYGRKFWLNTFLAFSLAFIAGEVFVMSSPWRIAFNSTASIPRGLYLTKELAPYETPQVGQIACFKYQEPAQLQGRSYFPEGSSLCKPVAAVAGDTLTQEGSELFLLSPGSPRQKLSDVANEDKAGRPLPQHFKQAAYELKRGEFALVAGDKPNSLDSRFLGVFKREQLFKTAEPLLTTD